jgi:Tol biopolymer transport system component
MYPDAHLNQKGQIRAVYAALTVSNSIWRIPLSSGGASGDPELLTSLYRAGSPSLSADGRWMLFSARQPLGETIQLADLSGNPPFASSTLHLGSNLRPVISGDGRMVAWVNKSVGYVMGVNAETPETICRACGQATHLNFDGSKAIFEASGSAEELILAMRGRDARPLFHIEESRQWMQAAGRFSPDERWVVFSGWHEGEPRRQILVVPVTSDGRVPPDRMVSVTADEFANREPVWAPDGRRIYFLSDHDGPDCVWARDVDPASKRPIGAAFAVAHFHSAGRLVHGPRANAGSVGLSVAGRFLVLPLTDTKGNIWSRATPADKGNRPGEVN